MKKQHGMTFLGLVIVLAIALSILLAGVKVVPAYLEHNSVRKVIESIGEKGDFSSMSKKDIMQSFNKSANTNYISVVKGEDLIISKDLSGQKVVSIEYQVVEPLAFNLSALMDFEASTED